MSDGLPTGVVGSGPCTLVGFTAVNEFKTPRGETYPGLLRENGYRDGHAGKWHNGKFSAKQFEFVRFYFGWHALLTSR